MRWALLYLVGVAILALVTLAPLLAAVARILDRLPAA